MIPRAEFNFPNTASTFSLPVHIPQTNKSLSLGLLEYFPFITILRLLTAGDPSFPDAPGLCRAVGPDTGLGLQISLTASASRNGPDGATRQGCLAQSQ